MEEKKAPLTDEEIQARTRSHIISYMTEKFKQREAQLWNVHQAAEFLNVSHRTIYNWISKENKTPGEYPIPVKKISHRCILFPNNLLIMWARNRFIRKWTPNRRRQNKS